MTLPDANTGSGTQSEVEPGIASRPGPPEPLPIWGRPGVRTGAVVLATVYLALATFPGDYRAITPGLDPSWTYAINVLPSTPFRFGQDVVFTYGPLGYLLAPQNIGTNLVQAAGMWVLTQGALVALVIYHYRRHRRLVPVVAFAVIFVLATFFGLFFEYRLLILVGLLLTVPPEDRGVWRWVAPAAAGLAAALLFLKFTVGLAAVGTVAVASITWLWQRRIRLGEVLLRLALVYMAVLAAGTIALIGSVGGFLEWLRLGSEIVGGFAAAMAVGEAPIVPIVALASAAVAVVALVTLGRRDRGLLAVALPLALPLYFAFRHSFVRHHGRLVFSTMLAAIAVVVLTATTRRRLLAGGAAALLVLPGAVFTAFRAECYCPVRPGAFGSSGWSNLAALVGFGETTTSLNSLSATSLANDRLPDEWVAEIRASGGSVDAVPWEIAFTVANDLPWTPNPVLQTYHAYTALLDDHVAEHFKGDEAPEWLLLQFIDIDGRHPMLASPATWWAILTHYELAAERPATGPYGQVLLLRRLAVPIRMLPERLGTDRAQVGEWIDVPGSAGLVLADIEVSMTLAGRLRELGWRTDVVYADIQYEPGGYVRVRILPRTVEHGLLLSHPPLTMEELVALMSGDLPRRVQRFRLSGEGLGSYGPEMRVQWWSVPWAPRGAD